MTHLQAARSRAVAVLLGIVVLVAGCAWLPPTIECASGVDRASCDRVAARVLEQKRRERPDHRIVSLRVSDPRGSYDLLWDDGMGEALIVD